MKLHNILQTEDIITVGPHNTLSYALNKLSSSHDAAFVFSEDNKYMGVINPYYCVIKTSSPSNAKIEHALYHAPRIRLNYPISKIAQLMIESKIHHLPVFDDKEHFKGIITARRLLRALENLDIFTSKIGAALSHKKISVITVNENDSLAYAIQKLKQYKISKLVAVNKEKRLRGILSYYDLISYLTTPKKRNRQDKSSDKVALHSKTVRHFIKTFVLTLNEDDYLRDALHLILEKKIGSVVIIDSQNRPVNLLTTMDLLSLFVRESTKKKIEITSKNLSKESRRILNGFFEQLRTTLKKKPDVEKANLVIKEEKQGGLFKVVLSLIRKKGKTQIIHEEGKNLTNVLNKVKKKEER
ncbi:MAG: CBS domain-containing protein [Patescibacteria group bacterium]